MPTIKKKKKQKKRKKNISNLKPSKKKCSPNASGQEVLLSRPRRFIYIWHRGWNTSSPRHQYIIHQRAWIRASVDPLLEGKKGGKRELRLEPDVGFGAAFG